MPESTGDLQPMPAGPNGGRSYGLVRGKNGLPRCDVLDDMPKQVWDGLSDADREHLLSVHGEYNPKYL